MLISMCSFVPGYVRLDLFSIFRVIALDLENFCNFQLVSNVTQKGIDKESLNLIGRLLSIFSFAPGVSLVDLSSICRVISLDLVKTISLCCYLFLECLSENQPTLQE
jgi:hypothetical protein